MTSADLREEMRALLMDLAPNGATGDEWHRALDVLLDATRRDCFTNSPATTWLMGSPSHRFLLAEYCEETKRIRVQLDDVDDDTDDPVATGVGESVEEAISAALNALQSKEH